MIVKKVIREGEAIPKYYGIAYRDILRREAVCYPIVLNLIIRYLREIYFIVAIPADLSRSEHIVQEAYRQGYEDGHKRFASRFGKAGPISASQIRPEVGSPLGVGPSEGKPLGDGRGILPEPVQVHKNGISWR